MIYTLWIAPFFLLLCSSYYFDNKKVDAEPKNIYVSILLDTIVSYALIMMFFTLFFSMSTINIFALLLVAVVSGFFLFTYSNEEDFSFDRQIETVKNNTVLFVSSVIVFTLFYMVFRNQLTWMRIVFSFIISGAFILIAFPIKKKMKVVYRTIYKKSPLFNYTTILTVVYAVLFVVVTILLIVFVRFVQTDFGYVNETSINTNYAVSGEIVDFYGDEYFYVYDENTGKEELHIKIEIGDTISYDIIDVTYDSSSPYQTSSSTTRFHNSIGTTMIFTPSYGAYVNGVLFPATEGLKTEFIDDMYCENCIVIEVSEDTYDIYDEHLVSFDSIDLTDSNQSLIIISDTLFLADDSYLYLYSDSSVKFEKHGSEMSYSPENKTLYTLAAIKDNVTYTIQGEDEILYTGEIKIQEGNTVHSLTTNILYNPVEIYRNHHIEKIDNDLYVHSLQEKEYWVNFVEYDIERYSLNTTLNNSFQLEYLDVNKNTSLSLPIINVIKGFVEEDHQFSSLPFVEVLISLSVLVSLIIPYSNYSKHDTVIDFESQFKNKKETK